MLGMQKDMYNMTMDFSDKKIELANQDRVKELEVQIDELLFQLGHEDALVTDESELCHFLDFFLDEDEKEWYIENLSSRLGVNIMDEYELMVNIAQRMKEKGN